MSTSFHHRTRNPEIYVKGYGKSVTKDDLKAWFKQYGKIYSIQYKGPYSFIEFEDYMDAETAIKQMSQKKIQGCWLTVQPSGKKRHSSVGDRERGSSHHNNHHHGSNNHSRSRSRSRSRSPRHRHHYHRRSHSSSYSSYSSSSRSSSSSSSSHTRSLESSSSVSNSYSIGRGGVEGQLQDQTKIGIKEKEYSNNNYKPSSSSFKINTIGGSLTGLPTNESKKIFPLNDGMK